jgi:hypothetical protein
MSFLQSQFAGANSPSEMGTTGLVAWVLAGNEFNRWERYRKALRVIRSRGLSQRLFSFAILQTGRQNKIALKRYEAAIQRRFDNAV